MTGDLQTVLKVVETLSPNDQLELIAAVSRALQKQYLARQANDNQPELLLAPAIPAEIHRTPLLRDITQLKADFWPEEETADDINEYLKQQRQDDLRREQNEHRAA